LSIESTLGILAALAAKLREVTNEKIICTLEVVDLSLRYCLCRFAINTEVNISTISWTSREECPSLSVPAKHRWVRLIRIPPGQSKAYHSHRMTSLHILGECRTCSTQPFTLLQQSTRL